MLFCRLLIFKKTLKETFRNTIRVTNSLDPGQAQNLLGVIWVHSVLKCYQQTTVNLVY